MFSAVNKSAALLLLLLLLLALRAGAQGEAPPTDPMAPVEGGSAENPPTHALPKYVDPPENSSGEGSDRGGKPASVKAAPAAAKPAVALSSSTAPSDEVAGHGFKVGGLAPKAKLVRPMHAIIHKNAADWAPLGIREGGVPGAALNSVTLKLLKIKGRVKGDQTKAKAAARLHKGAKGSTWLAISLYPKALERRRTHVELRFRIFEGYVEEVQAAAVTVTDRRQQPPEKLLDSYDLRAEGIEYQEERPGSGLFVVAELDPRPGASSSNSGRLENAEFADKDLGFVSLSWSAKGVRAAGK